MGKTSAVAANTKVSASSNVAGAQASKDALKSVSVSKAADAPKAGSQVKVKTKTNFLDAEYLAVILLIIIVFSGAKVYALSISAPDLVEVADKTVFNVDIINDSDLAKNISLNLYSPLRVDIFAPKQVAPNFTETATFTVYNEMSGSNEIVGTIELVSGEELVQKEVTLSLKENSSNSLSAAFGALFSFPIFNEEIASFSVTDWIFFWVLVIIAAVLVAAFISRLVRRAS